MIICHLLSHTYTLYWTNNSTTNIRFFFKFDHVFTKCELFKLQIVNTCTHIISNVLSCIIEKCNYAQRLNIFMGKRCVNILRQIHLFGQNFMYSTEYVKQWKKGCSHAESLSIITLRKLNNCHLFISRQFNLKFTYLILPKS